MRKVFILLSADTCFIAEEYDDFGHFITRIVDKQGQKTLPIRAQKIIDITLHLKGSDYRGAIRSSRYLLNIKKLPPIVLDSKEEMVLLPLHCHETDTTIYINFKNIYTVVPLTRKSSEIIFYDGSSVTVSYSLRTIYHKIAEAELLLRKMTYPPINPLKDNDSEHSD